MKGIIIGFGTVVAVWTLWLGLAIMNNHWENQKLQKEKLKLEIANLKLRKEKTKLEITLLKHEIQVYNPNN